MDWQTKLGIGITVAFFFAQYAFKAMPLSIAWIGISGGILLAAWGILPGHDKMPLWPSAVIIVLMASLVGAGRWYWDSISATTSESLKLNMDFWGASTTTGTEVPADFYFINDTGLSHTIKSVGFIERLFTNPHFHGIEDYSKNCLASSGENGFFPPSFYLSMPNSLVNMQDGSLASFLTPKSITVGDIPHTTSYALIPPRTTVKVSAVFHTNGFRDVYNIHVLCPVVRMLDQEGKDLWIVCKGSFRAQVYQDGDVQQPKGRLQGAKPATLSLFPLSPETVCRTGPF